MYIYLQCGSAAELTAGLGGGGGPWEGWEVFAVHLETWSIFWRLGQLSPHCREGGRGGGREGGKEGREGGEGGRRGGKEGGREGGKV